LAVLMEEELAAGANERKRSGQLVM